MRLICSWPYLSACTMLPKSRLGTLFLVPESVLDKSKCRSWAIRGTLGRAEEWPVIPIIFFVRPSF